MISAGVLAGVASIGACLVWAGFFFVFLKLEKCFRNYHLNGAVYVITVIVVCFVSFLFVRLCCSKQRETRQIRLMRRRLRSEMQTNQQEDIYNISSRVQGQGQWPTHDTHVPLDSFTIANELNKYNDAPPSYEEAMNIAAAAAAAQNPIAPAPKTTSTETTATSSSTTN